MLDTLQSDKSVGSYPILFFGIIILFVYFLRVKSISIDCDFLIYTLLDLFSTYVWFGSKLCLYWLEDFQIMRDDFLSSFKMISQSMIT